MQGGVTVYNIFSGERYCFQYPDETALAFIQAARADFIGAENFNIGGERVNTTEVITAI